MSLSSIVQTVPQYENLGFDDAESDLTSLSSASSPLSSLGSREHTPEPPAQAGGSTTLGNGKLEPINDSVFGSPGQRRIVNTYGRKGRSKSFSSKSGPASAAATPRSSPRKAIPSTSPLTPLSSSPLKSPRKRVMISNSPESPSKRRRLREALPDIDLTTSPTPSPSKSINSDRNRRLSSSSRGRKGSGIPLTRVSSVFLKEEWKLESIGKLVWVRINEHGKVPAVEHSQISYWWPGKVKILLSSFKLPS